jgi:creatinine amidohydrolase
MTHEWIEKTWYDIRTFLVINENHVVFLPVGSVEQHGPNLPLGTDYIIANSLSSKACERLNDEGIPAIKLQGIPYGLSSMWSAYSGTISLNTQTFMALIKDIITSALRNGVKRLIILNGHGGNSEALRVIAKDSVEEVGKGVVAVISWWEFVGDVINNVFETKLFHADEVETSVAMALGISVRGVLSKSPSPIRPYNEFWHDLDLTRRPKAYVYRPEAVKLIEPGSFGRPDLASKDKGEVVVKEFLERIVRFAKDLIENRV